MGAGPANAQRTLSGRSIRIVMKTSTRGKGFDDELYLTGGRNHGKDADPVDAMTIRMKRLTVPAVVSVALILGILPAHVTAAQTQLTTHAPAGSNRSSLLYRSTFGTTGLRGWHIHGLWHAGSDGVAGMIGSNSGQILAPVSVAHLRNFRVTASIRAVGPPGPPPSPEIQAYGLDLRSTIWKPGVRGGSFLSYPYPGPNLAWSNQRVGGNDVTLDPGFNTYRVDVHGNDYTLTINGLQIVQFPINPRSTGTRVGIWSDHRQIEVKGFTVTRLGGAFPLQKAPPMQALSLGRSDIPRSLRAAGGHYLTLEELAREGTESIDAIQARGEVLSYDARYDQTSGPSTLPWELAVSMAAYNSREAAQKALVEMEFGPGGPDNATVAHWVVGDLNGLGDGASILSYDSGGSTYVFITFRREAYVVRVVTVFLQGFVTHSEMVNQTGALAKIIDRHIRQAGHSLSP